MKLLVFKGVSNSDDPKYESVYRLIETRAKKYGYTDVDTSLRWPGHSPGGDVVTLDGAVRVAYGKLEKLEASRDEYAILARSFGCYVALKLACDKKPKWLRKIILWGPPPYWLMWKMWCQDIKTWKSKVAEQQTFVDDMLFPSLEPLECILPEMRYETVVAVGDQDPYVSHAYLCYLESLVQERRSKDYCQSIRFKDAVPGAVHSVTEDSPKPVIEAYLKALFE